MILDGGGEVEEGEDPSVVRQQVFGSKGRAADGEQMGNKIFFGIQIYTYDSPKENQRNRLGNF